MEIFGPKSLAVGAAHWRFQPTQDSLVVALKGTFRMEAAGKAQLSEEPEPITGDVFTGEEPDLGPCRYASDVVPLKPKADLLLVGTAHPPKPTTQCSVGFTVGNTSLSLRVTGDRQWLDEGRASAPLAFESMALGYERAFGGATFAANPVGKGAVGKVGAGRPLPNLEHPSDVAKTASDQPVPAGFGPLGPYWSHRMSKWPPVTQAYVERGWPWAPAELDYSYFNAAQPALQVDYLTGNETIVCEGLHREHRRYACELPGLRPRCFVLDQRDGGPRFREVLLRLDTLWVDMDAEKLVLVWRGNLPIATRDMEDVDCVYVALEQLSEPRLTLEQHRRVFELAREDAEAKPAPPVNSPAEIKLPPPPALEKPATVQLVAEPLPESLKKQLLTMGTPAAAIAALERGDEASAMTAMLKTFNLGQQDLDKMLAEQREVAKTAHVAQGGDPALFDPPIPKPKPAPRKEQAPVGWSRARVEAAKATGVSAAGADLGKLDLSELDLREMDFSGAIMGGVNLDGAKLDGAKLDGASLTAASATGASFQAASLADADLTALSAKGSDFAGAKLSGALFDNAELSEATLDRVEAAGAFFRRAKLGGASFKKADLKGAIMDGATLERATFVEAKLDEASAEGVTADGADFSKASLESFRGGEKSSYVGAKLVGCRAERSRWMRSNLELADFSRTALIGADLSRSNLSGATLRGADCQGADFTNANLGRADAGGANLAKAQLEGADLRRASFRAASLYQAALWLAQMEGADLEGAITAGTLLHAPVRNWAG